MNVFNKGMFIEYLYASTITSVGGIMASKGRIRNDCSIYELPEVW